MEKTTVETIEEVEDRGWYQINRRTVITVEHGIETVEYLEQSDKSGELETIVHRVTTRHKREIED